MKTLEIYNALREHMPASLAASWDNEGIMLLSDPDREIKHALVTLDVTESAVDAAIEHSCEMIVSHHPVIFKPIQRFDSPKLVKLVRAGISVLSFHTSLDCADGGTADTLAELLGLSGKEPLYDEGIPCGRVGQLPAPLDFAELLDTVKAAVSPRIIETVAERAGKTYSRIAVCPGEGKSLFAAALESGAAAYVCGAMSYNELCDAAGQGMAVIAAGHYETEQPICGRLANLLSEIGIECTVYESNPIKITVQTE
jgi:dinuclear metal center YbgI/SA1388 family protein